MIIDYTAGYGKLTLVYIIAYGGPVNGIGFGNWFRTKYLKLQLLHHHFAFRKLYVITFSTISTCCIKATVCSIRYVF